MPNDANIHEETLRNEIVKIRSVMASFLTSNFHTREFVSLGTPSVTHKRELHGPYYPPEPVSNGLIGYVSQCVVDKPIYLYSKQPSDVSAQPALRGYVDNHTDHASITVYTKPLQNRCYQRFTIAKELAHVILGNTINSTTSLDAIRKNINSMLAGDTRFLSQDHESEYTAYLMAFEMLLPCDTNFSHNAMCRISHSSSNGLGVVYDKIARDFLIPKNELELFIPDMRNVEPFQC